MLIGIAKEVQRYFWDVDPDALEVNRDKRFIIERILEKGDDAAVAWLREHYPEHEWKTVVAESRRLSAKSRNYWGIKLRLWSTWNQFMRNPAGIWRH